MGAKREMVRAEVLCSVQPRRYIEAATSYAMVLFFGGEFGEAEEVMRVIKHCLDKVR